MTQQSTTRHELSDRLEALALKLKMHVEQAKDDGMSDALHNLRKSLDDAFEAASSAVKDEGGREDVREVGRLLADAFTTTVNRASTEVRDLFDHKSSGPKA